MRQQRAQRLCREATRDVEERPEGEITHVKGLVCGMTKLEWRIPE
jgi:hypothetical protein